MKDWKLEPKHGRLTTPFQHYTAIADGMVEQLEEGFECRPGKAYTGMKTWVMGKDELVNMVSSECSIML